MERPVPNLLSKFGGRYVDLFDYWRFWQQLRSLCHQRCNDLPIEVCSPARLDKTPVTTHWGFAFHQLQTIPKAWKQGTFKLCSVRANRREQIIQIGAKGIDNRLFRQNMLVRRHAKTDSDTVVGKAVKGISGIGFWPFFRS
jgi:hypothetical protein